MKLNKFAINKKLLIVKLLVQFRQTFVAIITVHSIKQRDKIMNFAGRDYTSRDCHMIVTAEHNEEEIER